MKTEAGKGEKKTQRVVCVSKRREEYLQGHGQRKKKEQVSDWETKGGMLKWRVRCIRGIRAQKKLKTEHFPCVLFVSRPVLRAKTLNYNIIV